MQRGLRLVLCTRKITRARWKLNIAVRVVLFGAPGVADDANIKCTGEHEPGGGASGGATFRWSCENKVSVAVTDDSNSSHSTASILGGFFVQKADVASSGFTPSSRGPMVKQRSSPSRDGRTRRKRRMRESSELWHWHWPIAI